MVLLPLVEALGKIVNAAEQGYGRVFHEGAFPLCCETDTESIHARLGKVPLSSMGAGETVLPQAEESVGAERCFPTETFSPWRGSHHSSSPFSDGTLSRIGGYDSGEELRSCVKTSFLKLVSKKMSEPSSFSMYVL